MHAGLHLGHLHHGLGDLVRDLFGPAATGYPVSNGTCANVVALRSVARFQTWTPSSNEVRWMCSHDTTESEVEAFARAVRTALGAERRDVAS